MWYFMTKRNKKYYINVFLLIVPEFIKKIGSDERAAILKIASSVLAKFEEERCHPY